jgi:A/G-specific adenine glycosylase
MVDVAADSREPGIMTAAATAFRRRLLLWGKRNSREYAWRTDGDPFRVLLAEMLLTRTPAWKVERVWQELLSRYPTPHALARAHQRTIEDIVRPLGLIKRAPTLRAMAKMLVNEHGGEVPRDRGALRSLPGVGIYVTAAVRCLAFGQREVMVDGVTSRVVKRYFGLSGLADIPSDEVHRLLRAVLPRHAAASKRFNLALVDLAGTVCLPARPRCSNCPLAEFCLSAGVRYRRSAWREGRRDLLENGLPRMSCSSPN